MSESFRGLGATVGPIATGYDGPTRVLDLRFSNRPVRLVQPADPDRLLDDAAVVALNHREDYMPYWAYVWPGASLLAEAVARESWVEGTRALEIGCGLGLAGLVAVGSGLCVDFTDYDEAPLRFVERSLRENGFSPHQGKTRYLDWREPGKDRYAVILGADVLYESRLVPLVCDLISALLMPGGVALVAGPYRVATEELESCLESRGLVTSAEPIACAAEGLPPAQGTLHRIRRRS